MPTPYRMTSSRLTHNIAIMTSLSFPLSPSVCVTFVFVCLGRSSGCRGPAAECGRPQPGGPLPGEVMPQKYFCPALLRVTSQHYLALVYRLGLGLKQDM